MTTSDAFPWDWRDRNAYELLEVGRDATHAEIKQAYHLQQFIWHPDRALDKHKGMMEERSKALSEAFKCLEAPASRKRYDDSNMPREAEEAVFAKGKQRNPTIWKTMAAWMKDEGIGTPFHRRMAFQAGSLLERRRQPSEKQLKWMLEAWELALEEGFDPSKALSDG